MVLPFCCLHSAFYSVSLKIFLHHLLDFIPLDFYRNPFLCYPSFPVKIFFRKGGRGRGHLPVSPGGGRGGWPPACISAGPVPGGNTSSAPYLQNAPCQRAPTGRHLAGAPAAKLPPSHPPTFPVSADVMVPPARVDKCPRPPLFPVSPGRCGCPRPRLLVRRGEGHFPCTAPRFPCTALRCPRLLSRPPYRRLPRDISPLFRQICQSRPTRVTFSSPFFTFSATISEIRPPKSQKAPAFFVCLCSLTKISAKTRRFFRASRFIFFFTFPVFMLYY